MRLHVPGRFLINGSTNDPTPPRQSANGIRPQFPHLGLFRLGSCQSIRHMYSNLGADNFGIALSGT
jgi:hypothetical protein